LLSASSDSNEQKFNIKDYWYAKNLLNVKVEKDENKD